MRKLSLLCVITLIWMTGCSTGNEYWKKVYPADILVSLTFVEAPCGIPWWIACYYLGQGRIEVKKGLDKDLERCVIMHELKHLDGWMHDNRPVYAYDCGDGTLITGGINDRN